MIQYDLDLYINTSFNAIAHPLIVGYLWVKYVPDLTKGRKNMLLTRSFHIILLHVYGLHIWPWNLVTAHFLLKSSVNVKYEPSRAKWKVYMLWKKNFFPGSMTLSYKLYLKSLHTLNLRHFVSEVWARLDQGERRYALYKDFIYNSANLNIRPINKVKGHHTLVTQRHSVGEVWARLGQRDIYKICSRQVILYRQKDGLTNGQRVGQIVYYRAKAEWGAKLKQYLILTLISSVFK